MSDLGPEARSILGAGRHGDDPTAADRARVRKKLSRAVAAGALGAASAAAAESGAAAATAGKAALFLAWAKIAGGVLFVGALGAGLWYSRPLPPGQSPPASSVVSDSAPRPAPSPPAVANTVSPSEAPAPADMPSPSETAAPRSTAGARSAAPSASADALVEETRELREAHDAIRGGDPAKALKLLDEQSASHADGQLGQERAAARIIALCKLGNDAEARAVADAFVRDYPDSPLVTRVRGGCSR